MQILRSFKVPRNFTKSHPVYIESIPYFANVCHNLSDISLDGSVLSGPLWETEVRQKTFTWLARTQTWICSAQSLHVMFYDTLKHNVAQSKFFKIRISENEIDRHSTFRYTICA